MKQTTLIEGVLHRVIPEYPEEALREALVNAVAHRDYSSYVLGSQVRIEMYADRLEIISPGRLFGPVSLTNLETAQASRNQLLVRLLGEVGLVENRGSGIGNGLPFYRAYATVLTASCRWLPFVHKPGVLRLLGKRLHLKFGAFSKRLKGMPSQLPTGSTHNSFLTASRAALSSLSNALPP